MLRGRGGRLSTVRNRGRLKRETIGSKPGKRFDKIWEVKYFGVHKEKDKKGATEKGKRVNWSDRRAN